MTPGKWAVFEWDGNLGVCGEGPMRDPNSGDICYAPTPGANSSRPREQDRENMRAIAALPQLIEATERTIRMYESYEIVAGASTCGQWINDLRDLLKASRGGA